MSNPWCTAPSDIALTPFKQAVSDIEECNRSRGRSFPNATGKSSFISQLREVDEFLHYKRQSEFQNRAIERQPELKRAIDIADRLTILFGKLTTDLDCFNQSDHLKNSFVDAYRTSQIIWDDISQENKSKLVNSIRSAICEILKIFSLRGGGETFRVHEQNLSLLIRRTNVLEEDKEFDDYYLEDLYDLLTECSNSLDIIRRSSVN